MINERKEAQSEIEVVMLEQLVPQDHLLRKIDKYIEFSFIRDLTRYLYCHTNGRPAVDPVVLFKMLFIGYLYGIRSERQLVKDIEVNLAYRWFLGYSITEKIPDSSTISQNRIRRFKGTDIPQKIFDNIVFQAIEKGLVGGKILYSDSTHIKANANKSHNRIANPNAPPIKIGFIPSPPIIYSLCKYATNLLTLTSEDLAYFPRSQFPFHVRYRAI